MTIDKEIENMTTEGMTVGEANTAAHKRMDLRGTQRNQRRRSKQRLDETKAGLEILAWNVDAVEEDTAANAVGRPRWQAHILGKVVEPCRVELEVNNG